MTKDRKTRLGAACGWAALVYLVVSFTAFRFRHPGLTETKLFLHLPDAIAWRTLESK